MDSSLKTAKRGGAKSDHQKGPNQVDEITDLPVRSCLDAIEKLEWYAQRWKIETFHKILKSARAHDRPPGNTVIWRGLSRDPYELPGRAMISVESGADHVLIRAILESLRK